jgi:imidazolonepropionase-like amidohydrolase
MRNLTPLASHLKSIPSHLRAMVSAAVLLSFALAPQINAESYLIKNATVHSATAKGILAKADVLIKDGKILRVAEEIKNVVGNFETIDASGKHLTPGLINASTNMGLTEISAVSSTVDAATTQHNMGASFNIASAINLRSTLIPQNRMHGLTRAIVMPRAGESIFAGQAAIIDLQASKNNAINLNSINKTNVAQVVNYGNRGAALAGGSRASAMAILDKALTEAKYLQNNESRFYAGGQWSFSQSIDDLKALYSVLNKQTPLVAHAHRGDDILRLIQLSKKHNIKLVIAGGGEAWTVADALAKAKVPVLFDPMQNLPQFESLAIGLDGAAKLYKAGVKLLFTGGGTHNAYLVRQSAGNAVAYGLPADAAIEAMSINVADVFGIKNYGQIKQGMEADLVLWDGDPLELTSSADLVLIKGQRQPLVSRATRLRDRYWDKAENGERAYKR